jgi:actin related protein 2/3 complex subunit 1A/1B
MADKTKILAAPSAITCHAWNSDCSSIAICPNTNEVMIYNKNGKGVFELACTLTEHSQVVTGIAWNSSNKIVTCSQDRNAYVWELKDGEWSPTLVILRINRAATAVQWCPTELKFAVSSGARCISVCYYEAENNWWISKHIKKNIQSTVTCVDWHPNSTLIAAGACDYKARIFCAAVKGVDKKPEKTPWGGKMSFGECIAEFDFGTSWVHDISWAPSGNTLAFVSHDSCLTVVEAAGNMCQIKTKDLPYNCVTFLSEGTIVAAGHDCTPFSFTSEGEGRWVAGAKLDSEKKEEAKSTGRSAAFSKFQNADKLGTKAGKAVETVLGTIHQNAISDFTKTEGGFSTSGMDGFVVAWNLAELEKAVPEFKLV